MNKNIIHKADYKRTIERHVFGPFKENMPSPFCVGPKMVYNGNSYLVHRNWSKVTCKHCLRKKNKNA